MKKTKLLALILSAAMLTTALAGCGNGNGGNSSSTNESSQESTSSQTESSSEESSMSTEENGVNIKYSDAFSIEVLENGIKKVKDGENRELILIPKEIEEVPAEYAESIVIRTPVEKAVFLSSTQVCSLRPLNNDAIYDRVAGVSGEADRWSEIPGIQNRMNEGKIKNVGGDMGDPDFELIASLEPDVVFVYTGPYQQPNVIENLQSLGINYAVDNEYTETNYLGRMEWAKFVLTFFNEDKAAADMMSNVNETIENMKKNIEGLEMPKVIFASEYNGNINVCGSDSWLSSMIKDAGGNNVFAELPADGLSLSLEDFIAKANDADVIVYTSTPTWMPNMEVLLSKIPQLEDCKAVKEGRIWQYDDSFWMGIDKSEVMAEDMAAIFYPEKYEGRELTFFTKIAEK